MCPTVRIYGLTFRSYCVNHQLVDCVFSTVQVQRAREGNAAGPAANELQWLASCSRWGGTPPVDRALCAVWPFVQRASLDGAKSSAGTLASFRTFSDSGALSATAEQST